MAIVLNHLLDQASYVGGVFVDKSGQGNNGTPANIPAFAMNHNGEANKATIFVTANQDVIDVGNGASLSAPDTYTITAWIYLDSLAADVRLLFKRNFVGASNYDLVFKTATNTLALYVQDGVGLLFNRSSNPNVITSTLTWYHIAVSYDRNTNFLNFYVNGANVGSTTESALGVITTATNALIGAHGIGGWFGGRMSDMRLYNTVLSQPEIATIIAGNIQSLGGSVTPSGALAPIPIHVIGLSGIITPIGILSARSPEWLLIDEHLTWMGEWDATWSYNIDEVVLYKSPDGNEWHVFISKISHNVGNIPTSSAFAWRRLYQEKFL